MIRNKSVRLSKDSYVLLETIRFLLLQRNYAVNKTEVMGLALSLYKRMLEGGKDDE